MKTYCLKRNYKYVIYGAAFLGKLVLSRLQNAGYKVDAFLDKRAETICEIEGIPVFHPREFVNESKEKTVVIVALSNPFDHPMVAELLVDMGYKKIIYKMSVRDQYQAEYARNLFDTLEDIMNGLVNENTAVFEYEDSFKEVYFENAGVVKKTSDEVIAYVPVELCYCFEIPESEKEGNPDLAACIDKPILYTGKVTIDLFRGFEGYGNVSESIKEYEEFLYRSPLRCPSFPRTKQGINDIIKNRYMAFDQMSRQLNRGMDFFINNPIEVVWNEKGYFNVADGAHRICFFISKGLTRIPARMKRVDYKSWINEDKLLPCISFLKENEYPSAYAPVPHPNFYNYPTYRDATGIQRIQYICEYLNKQNIDIQGMKVLEVGSSFSYFAQFFYRMGADVTTVECQKQSFVMGGLLNELLYCSGIKSMFGDIAEINLPATYDITIMLMVLYPYVEAEKGRAILQKLDQTTNKFLLWESGDEPEKERKFIMTESSFAGYKKIAEAYGEGKIRELGIFCKE